MGKCVLVKVVNFVLTQKMAFKNGDWDGVTHEFEDNWSFNDLFAKNPFIIYLVIY